MKIAAFLITALANAGIAFFMFFALIMSLNGFSESQAMPGLVLFIVWSVVFSIITGVLSIFLANYLATKQALNKFVSALISILAFILVGGILSVVGFFAAVFLVSAMR
ncbi:MAG: hypothetical protein M3384_19300 [Acidobacteriota bacterium]|nr:hypothetical protein [Acidobacteriota bacterium]